MPHHYLGREDAPLKGDTWQKLDQVMVGVAKSVLTGRRLLHVEGPFGFGMKAVPLRDKEGGGGLISSGILPLSMIFRTFSLSIRDIAAFERFQIELGLQPLVQAAMEAASMEDALIFQGSADVPGLLNVDGSLQSGLGQWAGIGAAASDVIGAATMLDQAGFHGPYTLALAPDRFNQLYRLYPNGTLTELDHIKSIVGDGVVKAPALEGGGVLIASGKHIASIILGQDMSLGFIGPQEQKYEFSISETLALFVRQPKGICRLTA